ncbi:MAG: hypothetical protein ACYTG2_06910 [Planctomycetota bacterium]
MKTRAVVLGVLLPLVVLVPMASGQTIYGSDLVSTTVYEITMDPGGPCAAPNPTVLTWSYAVPAPCAAAPPPPGLAGSVLGDIALDKVTGTVFVTDGVVVGEYAVGGSPPLLPPGTPINAWFPPPTAPPMAPLSGMGYDSAAGILWVTDGALIAGFGPSVPGSCVSPPVLIPPFPHGVPGAAFLTDVDWDPSSGTLWASDLATSPSGSSGTVWNILVGGGLGPGGVFGLGFLPSNGFPPLGVAYDTATPGGPPNPPVAPSIFLHTVSPLFVTWFDTTVGVPPLLPFYAPIGGSIGPPTAFSGIAYAAHGVTYGVPPAAPTIGSVGESTSPGPSFGLTITGAPLPSFVWLIANFSFPGPGYLCPSAPAVGNPLYVDPTGALIVPIAPAAPGTMTIPAPLPGGVPTGSGIFVQAFMDTTPGLPGGPWVATEALAFTIGTP